MDKSIKMANILFHNETRTTREYNKMIHQELQSESNADVFAFKNFYLVWNKLKENKLI